MRRILIFIALCMALNSCLYSNMTHLSEDDLGWVACAHKYPCTNFESNWGNKSVVTYDNYFEHNSTDKFCNVFRYVEVSSKYEAYAGYDFTVTSLQDTISGVFRIYLFVGSDTLKCWIRLGRMFSYDNKTMDNYIKVEDHNLIINGLHLKNCIIVDSVLNGETISLTNSNYSNQKRRVCKYIISKKYGLVYYKYADGEEFTIRLDNTSNVGEKIVSP